MGKLSKLAVPSEHSSGTGYRSKTFSFGIQISSGFQANLIKLNS